MTPCRRFWSQTPYPEAIDYLKQHADVDYVSTDDGLSTDELIQRARGKQAIVSQLVDRFTPNVLDQLEGVRVISNVAVGFDNITATFPATGMGSGDEYSRWLTDTTADFAFALLLAAARL